MTERAAGRWHPSRIGLRLLAFNVLVVFVPVVGVLYLDVYEARMLEAQERAMVQQARLLAAAIGEMPALDGPRAQAILNRLGRRSDARLRVFDGRGESIADSVRAFNLEPDGAIASQPYTPPTGVRQRLLYRVGALLARARSRTAAVVRSWFEGEEGLQPTDAEGIGVELQAALAGRYGATTRRTAGQRSLTMFSAVPVQQNGVVVGAVVVSQSTFRILQALYEVRLRVFEVVVASLAVAALLTTVAATTIVTPLARLRRAAGALSARGGPLPTQFPGTARRDEIGELARALEELTRRLTEHIALLEGFAADVSHEFKNPLAAIRSAAETIEAGGGPDERQRFLSLMIRDVGRLERLVSGLRELAHVDRRIEDSAIGQVDAVDLMRRIVDGANEHQQTVAIRFETDGQQVRVRGDSESLALVFENLLSNAISFAPPASVVDVEVAREVESCSVAVSDCGPGIPDAHLERVFDRFFTYRPTESGREHLGLGLAIARRIVHGHGGTIVAGNRPDGGARFEVRLPLTRS
jgi:two-component system sensor histidine kinase ChvG